MRGRWRKPTEHYEKTTQGKPRRLGQNAPLSRMLKIKLKNARLLPAKTKVSFYKTFSLSLRQKHPPATILLSTLNELFLNQLVKQLLNGSDTDSRKLFHIR